MEKPVPKPSRTLGTLPGLRWLVDWRWAPALPALISLVIPVLLAIGLEWRIPNPLRQYKGVSPGDLFLSIAGGISLSMAIRYVSVRVKYPGHWYEKKLWQFFSLGYGVAFAAFFAYAEVMNTIHQYVPSAAYTVPQLVSPTHLYHSVIIVLFGYMFWALVVPTWVHAPWRFWPVVGKVAVLALIVGWGFCAFYLDNHLPRPDLTQIHGEWFGGHWRNFFPMVQIPFGETR